MLNSVIATSNKQAGYKALGYFPIRVAGTSLGCVVYNGRQARKLTADEIRLLRSMCDQIGVAINNINLFEEVREKTAQQVSNQSRASGIARSANAHWRSVARHGALAIQFTGAFGRHDYECRHARSCERGSYPPS